MIYVEQEDKRLCVPDRCTATSFFGPATAQNQKATAHTSNKLQGIKCKSKRERVSKESCPCSPRPVLRFFGRFAKPARSRVAIRISERAGVYRHE